MKKKILSFVLFFLSALAIGAGAAPCEAFKAETVMAISDSHLTKALENHQTALDAVVCDGLGLVRARRRTA